MTAQQPARSGWHPVEWACELIGTALLLLGGLSAVCLNFGTASPLRAVGASPRLLLTGLLFAGTGSLIAISPLGRRSGAHLNPVVTLAFWTQHKVHRHDLIGYVTSQLLGAVLGAAAVLGLWRGQARSVSLGVTRAGPGVTNLTVLLLEMVMTATLLLVILLMTSSARTARWTPLLLWPLLTVLVWRGAPYTGTSLNPARSLGPAVLGHHLEGYWLYVLGPVLGCGLAVAVFGLLTEVHVVTAKLFHDRTYPCTLASSLPTG